MTKKKEKLSSEPSGMNEGVPGVAPVEDREVVCPSCFRFTGTYEKCPYCGAQVYKRLSIRFFRWGSLCFAIIGLFLLWMAAKGIKAPVVKVSSLEPSMSMGFVRIVGKITNEPSLHPQWQSLYLRIDDGTGEVSVNAFREIAVKVVKKMPLSIGDEVSVQGMIRFRGDPPKPRLLLQSPAHIQIIKKAPPKTEIKAVPMPVKDVVEFMKGRKVVLTGLLTKSDVLGFGAYRGVLSADGASIVVWVSPQKWQRFNGKAKSCLVKGKSITVRGYVETYFDKGTQKTILEIIPDGGDGCVVPAAFPSSEPQKKSQAPQSGDTNGGSN